MFAHGGLFKTKGVAQRFLAAAIDTPVAVGDVAAEGGAWGIAVLAAFSPTGSRARACSNYLDDQVFADVELDVVNPDPTMSPASRPSSSATSAPYRWSRPPPSTSEPEAVRGGQIGIDHSRAGSPATDEFRRRLGSLLATTVLR